MITVKSMLGGGLACFLLLLSLSLNAQPLISADEAARVAFEVTGGQVVNVQGQPNRQGRYVYRVRVLMPNGRVRDVVVDGQTGQIR